MGESRPPPATANRPAAASVSLLGRGRVQKRIWRCFVANPGKELRTTDLVAWAYPRTDEPTRNQRRAIRRAAALMADRVRRDYRGVLFQARAEPLSAEILVK